MARLTADQERELRGAFNLFDSGIIEKIIKYKLIIVLYSMFRSFG